MVRRAETTAGIQRRRTALGSRAGPRTARVKAFGYRRCRAAPAAVPAKRANATAAAVGNEAAAITTIGSAVNVAIIRHEGGRGEGAGPPFSP